MGLRHAFEKLRRNISYVRKLPAKYGGWSCVVSPKAGLRYLGRIASVDPVELANRRLIPRLTQENRGAQAKQKYNAAGETAVEKTLPQPRRRGVSGYISNVSTIEPRVTCLNCLTRGTHPPHPPLSDRCTAMFQ